MFFRSHNYSTDQDALKRYMYMRIRMRSKKLEQFNLINLYLSANSMCFELVGLLKKASHAFTNSYTVHICNCSVYCRGKGKDVIYHSFSQKGSVAERGEEGRKWPKL